MKISRKLFILLLLIIISLVLVCSLVLLRLTENRLDDEKLASARMSVRQMLLAYEYVTSDIERYVYDRCRSEEIASFLNGTLSGATAAQSLRVRLRNIVYNNPYLSACIVFDLNGRVLSSYEPENETHMKTLYQQGFFSADEDVSWTVDGQGRLYLSRSIYQIYPYRVVGYGCYMIDQEHLKAAVGMDSIADGCSCVIDKYGTVALLTESTAGNAAVFADLIDLIRQGQTLPVRMRWRGEDYRVIAVSRDRGQWNALYAVSTREFLASFYSLRYGILIAAVLLTALAALASYGIANAFTRNLRALKKHVNDLKGDVPSMRIPPMGRDEVGELADDFNRLLGRLDHLYHQMLRENARQQKMEYELLEFKYRSLQAQMSPHFLCNILSSISVLSMAGKSRELEQLAIDASVYLRGNLNSTDKKYNSVAQELRMAQEYVRLAEQITVIPVRLRVDCPEELYDVDIPNMLVQPFVENSLKHGIAPQMETPFYIDIHVSREDKDRLCLMITDNGVGYREDVLRELDQLLKDRDYQPKHVGFGTAGVIRRLTIQYGSHFVFEVSNKTTRGAVTRIVFPLTKEERDPEDEAKEQGQAL